jgi:hypothetical protein
VRTLACLFTSKDEKLGTINERTVYIGGAFNASIAKENKCIYEVKITPKTVLFLSNLGIKIKINSQGGSHKI